MAPRSDRRPRSGPRPCGARTGRAPVPPRHGMGGPARGQGGCRRHGRAGRARPSRRPARETPRGQGGRERRTPGAQGTARRRPATDAGRCRCAGRWCDPADRAHQPAGTSADRRSARGIVPSAHIATPSRNTSAGAGITRLPAAAFSRCIPGTSSAARQGDPPCHAHPACRSPRSAGNWPVPQRNRTDDRSPGTAGPGQVPARGRHPIGGT